MTLKSSVSVNNGIVGMIKLGALFALLLTASACSPADNKQPSPPETIAAHNEAAPAKDTGSLQFAKPGQPGGLPEDRSLLAEGTIDPKSGQGAAQVLQQYFALLEEGALHRAAALWSDRRPSVEFASELAQYAEVHANVGRPGGIEGAAGSLYVDVPIQLYGRLRDRKQFNALGSMTLRRINDVPGSSPEQREWHIYKSTFPPLTQSQKRG